MPPKDKPDRREELLAAVTYQATIAPEQFEVTAISLCVTILGKLREPERARVMRYLIDRYRLQYLARQSVVEVGDDPDDTE